MMVIISPINYCLRALFFVILFAVAFTASPCNGMNMQAANNGIDELEPETFFSSSCNAQNESCESGMAIDHKKKGKIVQSSNIHDNLIEWIQSHNSGFVNEKLEIRLADPIDPTSGSGLFVKERVEEDHVREGEGVALARVAPHDRLSVVVETGLAGVVVVVDGRISHADRRGCLERLRETLGHHGLQRPRGVWYKRD